MRATLGSRDVDIYLGLAYLETGDPALALAPLEQAADPFAADLVTHASTAMADLALAGALWDTGGDKARARLLAGRARDRFERLGPFREPSRQRAIQWLADHR